LPNLFLPWGVSLAEILTSNFPNHPTQDQSRAFQLLSDFVESKDELSAFILKGYAGTGKTTLITALVKVLPLIRMRTVLIEPTGCAAKDITYEWSNNA